MGYNENFSRAYFTREIPSKELYAFLQKLVDTDDEEKEQIMMDQFAAEAERLYPYRKGKEPKEEN